MVNNRMALPSLDGNVRLFQVGIAIIICQTRKTLISIKIRR
jgi:hypothetical protein